MMKNKVSGEARLPYHEIRGSKLNSAVGILPRVLICILAVMLFLVFTNPAQTALLGRATVVGMAFDKDGMEQLTTAENEMLACVNALENAAAALKDKAALIDGSRTNLTSVKTYLKEAQTAYEQAAAALETTLGAEYATQQAVAGADMTMLTADMAFAKEQIVLLEAAIAPVEEAEAAASAALDALKVQCDALAAAMAAVKPAAPAAADPEQEAAQLAEKTAQLQTLLADMSAALSTVDALSTENVSDVKTAAEETVEALKAIELGAAEDPNAQLQAAMDTALAELGKLLKQNDVTADALETALQAVNAALTAMPEGSENVEAAAAAYEEAKTALTAAKDAASARDLAAMEMESPLWSVAGALYTVDSGLPEMKSEPGDVATSLASATSFVPATTDDTRTKYDVLREEIVKVNDLLARADACISARNEAMTAAATTTGEIAPAYEKVQTSLTELSAALTAANDAVSAADNAEKAATKASDAAKKAVTQNDAKAAEATAATAALETALTTANDAMKQAVDALNAANAELTAGTDAGTVKTTAETSGNALVGALNAVVTADTATEKAEEASATAATNVSDTAAAAETAQAAADEAKAAADEAVTNAIAAMNGTAAVLLEAEAVSAVAKVQITTNGSAALVNWSRVLVLGVLVGVAGMILTLGNNRMRRLGFMVLLAGSAAALVSVVAMKVVLDQIAQNAQLFRDAYGLTLLTDTMVGVQGAFNGNVLPETLSAALADLALDTPDALWVTLVLLALTVLSSLVAWMTLPKQLEEKMQIDLLTIFQRLTRVLILVTGIMVFFPSLNPGRISALINENTSLFTVATSYGTITDKMKYALDRGIVDPGVFKMLMVGAAIVVLGILLNAAGACMSLGNNRMKKKGGYLLPMAGSMAIVAGLVVIFFSYNALVQETVQNPSITARLQPMLPGGFTFWAVSAVLIFICSFVSWYLLPDELEEKMEMDERYRNFLMFLPVLLLTFIFCYLPIWGWRFAFFDYKIGDQMLLYDTVVDGVVTQESNFTGLKWFVYLFENPANRSDLIRVLRNTLVMSGLGIATSWLPIAFAVLLAEVRSSKFQRVVQTLTTIPNFISWVLVYAIAFAIFSTDGFINSFLRNVMGVAGANTDYLASADWIWVKMLLWGTWKGLGWSAIVYIAGIAGIDQQLYEAARVDGANRFQCIRHITIPGLMPTYMVMLLMSVAGMLSNGMDQYLVFENPINTDTIEVLDLYVYNIGIRNELYPLSTVVGVFKSLIGVTLLFGANGISKAVRGESII